MEFIGYYPQWAIYDREFFLKNIDENGTAERLTILNYAFENLTSGDVPASGTYPEGYDGYRCFEEIRARDTRPGHENTAAAGINSGDAGADYLFPFRRDAKPPKEPIGDDDPGWNARALMGNFNQLRRLRARHPRLKVLISLGGWTYGRNWSLAVRTEQGRRDLVSSCVDLFIKGNLPTEIWAPDVLTKKLTRQPHFGGPGTAAGIFDGVDIDWEWPGCDRGQPGNAYDPEHDKGNFVELLKEFRRQLSDRDLVEMHPPRGGKYLLTAFLPADPQVMAAGWDAPEVMKYLDFGNIQGYDFHGPWETPVVTDQQSALYPPNGADLSVRSVVDAWIAAAGEEHRAKLTFGIPYYGRGWRGVGTEHADGLLNTAQGPARGAFEDGVDDYRALVGLDPRFHPDSGYVLYRRTNEAGVDSFAWLYSRRDRVLWTYDDPAVVYDKAAYARRHHLGGVMVYSLDGDDPRSGVLSQCVRAGLDGR